MSSGTAASTTWNILRHAVQIAAEQKAEAVLICGKPPENVREVLGDLKAIFVTTEEAEAIGTPDERSHLIHLAYGPSTRLSLIQTGLLLALTRGLLQTDDTVVCVSGPPASDQLDSIIVVRVRDEFGTFLAPGREEWLPADIQPNVLQRVIELATELGIEGREGRTVGALFVIGDMEQVLPKTRQMVLNPFQGYKPESRNILDSARLGETVKEFSTIDGAFLIRNDGTIESVGAYIDSALLGSARLPPGLGARHQAAAAITNETDSVAVALSQSTGVVTIFRKGKIITELPKPPGVQRGIRPTLGRPTERARPVIVVGGGINGLSIALFLAQAGLPVVAIGDGPLGAGRVTRDQGWLWSGAWIAPNQPDLAWMCYQSLRQTLELCPECVEPQTNTMLYWTMRAETNDDLWTTAWHTSGIPYHPAPESEWMSELPGVNVERIRGAYRLPDCSIRTDVLVKHFAFVATQAGAEIRTDSPVTKLLCAGQSVEGVLTASGEEVRGRLVILASAAAQQSLLASQATEDVQLPFPGLWTPRKTHLVAIRPTIGPTPFCLLDQEGFNHLPHGAFSIFNSNRWIAADDLNDYRIVPDEIHHIWQTIEKILPGLPRDQLEVFEWADTVIQGAPSDTSILQCILPPMVIDHEHAPVPLRNLVSAFTGRMTLWPALAEQTRQFVLQKLGTAQTAAPP